MNTKAPAGSFGHPLKEVVSPACRQKSCGYDRHGSNTNSHYYDLHDATGRFDFVLANPPFNDSDTAMRDGAFLQSEAKMQVVSEATDSFRKDDDQNKRYDLCHNPRLWN